jgi:ribosome-binding factor A
MEKELLKLISSALTLRMRDQHLANVTITAVRLSPDFSTAKIYFTDFSEYELEIVGNALVKSTGFFKNEIAKTKMMRTIPELIFCFDEAEERAKKLDLLFEKIKEEEK